MAENNSSPMTQPENIQASESTPVAVAEPNPAAGTPNGTAPTTPVKPKKIKKKTWFARHKVLTIILVLILALVGFFTVNSALAAKKNTATTYQYIRTTTLKKTTLSNSVSVTGTVASGSVASVTVADTAKTYKVATVDVQVGDKVNNGDVICTLDTTDLEKSIASAQQSYNDTLTSAQLAYNRAKTSYDTYVTQHENNLIDLQAKIDQADKTLSDAQTAQNNAQKDYDSAKSDYDGLNSAYNNAKAQIKSFTDLYNSASAMANTSLSNLNAKLGNYNSLLSSYMNGTNTLIDVGIAADALIQESYNYNGDAANYAQTIPAGVNSGAVQRGEVGNYVYGGGQVAAASSYVAYMEKTQKDLASAQETCSYAPQALYGFTSIEKAYQAANTTYTAADKTLTQAKTAVDQATQAVQSAHDAYDKEKNYSNLTSLKQQIEDAALKLTQAKRTPDNMTTLQDTVAKCTLTATMSGTITALNATVGSVCSGTVATIQDTDGLTVSVTIPSNDVVNLTTGMNCNITSDATGDKTINGTLTQIDPVANDKGSFGAKVTVSGDPDKLLIGMQAKVEIFESTADNVFVVPLDAVGTAEDGTSFVRRKTGGTGVDMTFEEITVTTGASNDYNVEISADTLAEGDVIRASADLTVGTETTDATTDPFGEMAVAQTGGEAPSDGGTPPDGGGAGGGPQGGGQ